MSTTTRCLFIGDGVLDLPGDPPGAFRPDLVAVLSRLHAATGATLVAAARFRIYPKMVRRLELMLEACRGGDGGEGEGGASGEGGAGGAGGAGGEGAVNIVSVGEDAKFDGPLGAATWASQRWGGDMPEARVASWVYVSAQPSSSASSSSSSSAAPSSSTEPAAVDAAAKAVLPGAHVLWHSTRTVKGKGLTMDVARRATEWLVAAVRRPTLATASAAAGGSKTEEDEAIEHLDEARRSNADALVGLPDAAATRGGKVWVMGGGNMFLRVDRDVASGVLVEAQARLAEDAKAAAIYTLFGAGKEKGGDAGGTSRGGGERKS